MSHPVSAPRSVFSRLVSSKAVLSVAAIVGIACSRPKPAESGAPQGLSGTPSEPAAPAATHSTDPAPLPRVPVAPASPEAAPDAPEPQTLFVHEQRNDCQGEAPMKCLQIRESDSDPWRNFYGRIEGFEYEEGHAYELRVEVTPVPNPPADAPNQRYRLIEVVSKRKVEGGAQP
jgi:hypothetical protein